MLNDECVQSFDSQYFRPNRWLPRSLFFSRSNARGKASQNLQNTPMVEQRRAGRQRADLSVNVAAAPRSTTAVSFFNIKEWITSREELGCFSLFPFSTIFSHACAVQPEVTFSSSSFNCSYFRGGRGR